MRLYVLRNRIAAKLVEVDFIRAIGEAEGPGNSVKPRKRAVLAKAHAAVDLHGAVDNAACHTRGYNFDHSNQVFGSFVALLVHLVSRVEGQQAGLGNFAA